MDASVLARLTLGYRHLWDRRRLPVAVELFVDADAASGVDARHLVSTLNELWPTHAPRLLLSPRSPPLLHDLLQHIPSSGPALVVASGALAHPVLRERVRQARRRGLSLVWAGQPGEAPPVELAEDFQRCMLRLSNTQTLGLLQAARTSGASPQLSALQEQVLADPGQPALAAWALERQGAWAVAGWPQETSRARRPAPPAVDAIDRLLRAIDRDQSLTDIERLFFQEPVLAYRLLAQLNSSAVKLREPIDNIQRGLMVWGLGPVQTWLRTQRAGAEDAPDLRPVRHGIVTRTQLLVHLLEPGDEEELRSELLLCGLLSQLERLLGEPLADLVQRLPLSQRVLQALLKSDGPYHPGLQLARLLEAPATPATRQFCQEHGFDPEHVNRALLRTLAASNF